MNVFSQTQRYKALFWLSLFHLLVITSSNYLVQLPVSILGFHTTWGAFSFPFIFLATDLTVRIFGAPLARRIIFAVMIPALLISYVISSLFYMGSWQGFGALAHFNLFVARIATASFMAYALGQILDVHVFNRLRQSRRWWLAPTASTLFGNVSDTLAFFFIAFWRSPDAFMAEHWMEIALVDYCFKVLISIVFFLPMYGVLLNMLFKRLADKSEINALQASQRFVIRVVIRWMNEPLWPFIERKKSMRNLVKYVGIGLLVMGLAACDDKDTNATAQGSVAESNATGNPVNLLDGKLSFSLPADMTDQSGKLGTQANNMHVWSDATGQKAVIVIMGDDPKEDLAVLAKRLEDQQRSRDPQLQVVTNKAIELKGHKMQQLDSIISAKGQTAYSSVILGNVGNQLLTMQITLPADDQQKAQTTAENIINTLVIQ